MEDVNEESDGIVEHNSYAWFPFTLDGVVHYDGYDGFWESATLECVMKSQARDGSEVIVVSPTELIVTNKYDETFKYIGFSIDIRSDEYDGSPFNGKTLEEMKCREDNEEYFAPYEDVEEFEY